VCSVACLPPVLPQQVVPTIAAVIGQHDIAFGIVSTVPGGALALIVAENVLQTATMIAIIVGGERISKRMHTWVANMGHYPVHFGSRSKGQWSFPPFLSVIRCGGSTETTEGEGIATETMEDNDTAAVDTTRHVFGPPCDGSGHPPPEVDGVPFAGWPGRGVSQLCLTGVCAGGGGHECTRQARCHYWP